MAGVARIADAIDDWRESRAAFRAIAKIRYRAAQAIGVLAERRLGCAVAVDRSFDLILEQPQRFVGARDSCAFAAAGTLGSAQFGVVMLHDLHDAARIGAALGQSIHRYGGADRAERQSENQQYQRAHGKGVATRAGGKDIRFADAASCDRQAFPNHMRFDNATMRRLLGVRALNKDQNFKTDRATVLDPATTQETQSSPRLIIVSGVLLGHQIELGETPVTIGRSSECTIALPHPSVSRQHCRIWRENGRYRIEDLGSTNRTFLNGEVVTRADLRDGDQISVGSNALKFFLGASVEARYHDELIDLAIYDSLTGFYNRRHFRSMLDDELKKCADDGVVSLLMLDLDYFKAINDQHGHLVGDQVLSGVADVLRARAPANAFVGRLGGEEFAMVLRDTGLVRCAVA